MDSRRVAPTLGLVASVAVVALLAVPYLVVDDSAAVSTYYGSGAITPWAAGLMALIAVVVFAAGREERTHPETAAGAGLVFGAVTGIVSLVWAITVPVEVPLQITETEPIVGPLTTAVVIEYHRWVLAAVSILPAIAAVWYARALRLL